VTAGWLVLIQVVVFAGGILSRVDTRRTPLSRILLLSCNVRVVERKPSRTARRRTSGANSLTSIVTQMAAMSGRHVGKYEFKQGVLASKN